VGTVSRHLLDGNVLFQLVINLAAYAALERMVEQVCGREERCARMKLLRHAGVYDCKMQQRLARIRQPKPTGAT
jgi:hypothetical protein